VGLTVTVWEWRKIVVEDTVTLTLTLPQGEYVVQGVAVNLRREVGQTILSRTLGVHFASDVAYGKLQPSLCQYLLNLASEIDAEYLENRQAMLGGGSR